MIRRLLLFIMWFVALPFLSLHAQSPGGVVRTAEGDSTTAGNQSMRVVTFKAVPGTARTYYYHRDHLGSTTLITNESGEVVQRVEYLPTGETYIEQQDTSWVSPTSSTAARPFGTLSKQRGERRSWTRCTA